MQAVADFQSYFVDYLQKRSFKKQPTELYEPVNYILSLGGKRLRPVLVLMGYQLFQADVEKALPAALAVEVFHNFSLVHDDIMDEAPLRRGQASVHEKYSVNHGILSGDVMLIYCYTFLQELPTVAISSEAIRIFNEVAIGVCEGQQMDMNFEQRMDVSIEEYLKMIELKTAVLIAGGLKIGALIGGASPTDQNHLSEFGRNIGIAFQLQDDYLDTFGDPEKFGKKVGGDIAQNKKTFLLLKALALAEGEQKVQLLNWLTAPCEDENEKIASITALYKELGIPQLAESKKMEYQSLAFDHLAAVDLPEDNKKLLAGLAHQLLGREY